MEEKNQPTQYPGHTIERNTVTACSQSTTAFNYTDSNFLNLILSNSEGIFLLIDRDLKIQLYNEAARQGVRQYFHKNLQKGDLILDYADPERLDSLKETYNRVFDGKCCESEIEIERENASKIFHIIFRPAIDTDGQISAALISVLDVTEERNTKRALIESEERFRFAMEASNHGIWDWNIKTGTVFFSSSWKKMLGFEEWEIKNNIGEWEKRIHPDDKAQLKRDLQTHFNSQQPIYENSYRLRAKDDTYRWILGRGKIVETAPDGTPLRMIGTHTDVTEKRQSEEQYRTLFDVNPLPSWIYDYDTLRFLTVNKAAVEHYGYTKAEFLAMTVRDLQPEAQLPKFNELIQNRKSKNNYTNKSWQHKKKNGDIIIVEINGTTIQYNNRHSRLIVVNDITEKVAAEKELQASYQRFEHASKATSDAIYEWDIAKNHLKWSEGLTTLFGYQSDEITIAEWENHLHPDERAFVSESLNKAVFNSRKKRWTMEYRFLKSDGTYRYVIEKGFILRDQQSNPLKMIGAMQDITNFKLQQLALTESNKRYEYATLAISDIIWDWDLEKDCILWSDNYEKITGWVLPPDKCLLLSTCYERFHDNDRNRVINSVNNALLVKEQQVWEAELKYIKANGELADMYNRAYILRNENGIAVRLIGAMQEITQRKKLEEALMQKELDKQKMISKATIDTQERERSEIGRELHDNVNQVLTTTKLYLELALSKAELKDELLQKSEKNIMYVINEIRQLSHSLMNPSLGDLGLLDSLNDLIENLRATRKMKIHFEADESLVGALSANLELTIYRIIQEALNNVVKHAKATQVQVKIVKNGAGIEIVIHDNGIGFDKDAVKKGSGLNSIQNRVYLTNGTLRIQSEPGAGCTLSIHFIL